MTPLDFHFEADHLALDFLNTGIRGGREGVMDALTTPEHVAAWLARAGLASTDDGRRLAASPPLARTLFAEALALRSALADVVAAFQRGSVLPEPALFALNRVLRARRAGLRLSARGTAVALAEDVELSFPLGLLTPVAAAAAELLASGDPKRVGQCAAEGCGRWFYDISRNGSRRWCSMARCGNRAKVAAHYRRRRDAASAR
jgi:predicted RNA-binding Zn ribbon-like protein